MNLPDDDSAAVAALQRVIAELPRSSVVWERASENVDHVGGLLADASLQPGLDYRTVVAPRVRSFVEAFPSAATVAGLLDLLATRSASEMLRNKNARKCQVFHNLALLLHAERVDSAAQLRTWLDRPSSRDQLLALHGVGIKTAAYLRLLVGLPSIAIDIHLRRAAADVGVKGSDEVLERLYTAAALKAGVDLAELDGSLWQQGADKRRRNVRGKK